VTLRNSFNPWSTGLKILKSCDCKPCAPLQRFCRVGSTAGSVGVTGGQVLAVGQAPIIADDLAPHEAHGSHSMWVARNE